MAVVDDRTGSAAAAGPRRASAPGGVRLPLRTAALVLGLVLLTFTAFLPVRDAGFTDFDDPEYVTGNAHVLAGLRAAGIAWALSSFEQANWHPLTWGSHMLDVSLFGLRAGPHHLVSLSLHAASTALLFLLLAGSTGARWPSLLTAALFAVHPLRVESVAWIAERKDVLSVLLGMLALLAYLRYVRRPGAPRLALVAALLSLGLMAKPMLVTLPLVLLLLDWWPLGRFRAAAPPAALHLLLEKLPLLLPALASCVVTYLAQRQGGAMTFADVFPLQVRLGNAAVSYVGYLEKTLWPRQLIPFYPHPGLVLSPAQIAVSALLLAALTAGALARPARRPWLVVGWLWYLGTLVPVIGLVQVGLQGMADRYSYLPSAGLLLALCWECRSRTAPSGRGRLVSGAGALCTVAALAALTVSQTGHWQNTITLFNRVLSVDPRNFLAFNVLGSAYLRAGETERAQSLFGTSLAIKPDYTPARYNLGLALAKRGEKAAALEQFDTVLRANPRDAESLFNRGRLLLDKGQFAAALRDFDAAADLSPEQAVVHGSRGLALALLGRHGEARTAFERALAFDARNVEARFNLGRALDALGRPEEAIAQLQAALAIEPAFAEAHNFLGVVLAERGRLGEALAHFETAVRLDPHNAEAGSNLERARRGAGATP